MKNISDDFKKENPEIEWEKKLQDLEYKLINHYIRRRLGHNMGTL